MIAEIDLEGEQSWLVHLFDAENKLKAPILCLMVLETHFVSFLEVLSNNNVHRFPLSHLCSAKVANLPATSALSEDIRLIKLSFSAGNTNWIMFSTKDPSIWSEVVACISSHPNCDKLPKPDFSVLKLIAKLNFNCDKLTVVKSVTTYDRNISTIQDVVLKMTHFSFELKRNSSKITQERDVFRSDLCRLSAINWSSSEELTLSFEGDAGDLSQVTIRTVDAFQMQEIVTLILARSSFHRRRPYLKNTFQERTLRSHDLEASSSSPKVLENRMKLPDPEHSPKKTSSFTQIIQNNEDVSVSKYLSAPPKAPDDADENVESKSDLNENFNDEKKLDDYSPPSKENRSDLSEEDEYLRHRSVKRTGKQEKEQIHRKISSGTEEDERMSFVEEVLQPRQSGCLGGFSKKKARERQFSGGPVEDIAQYRNKSKPCVLQ